MIQYETSPTDLWRELFEYWKSKQSAGDCPPARRDLDPIVDIPRLAGNLVLIDVRPDGYWYRLVGTTNTAFWGEDPTGRQLGSSNRLPRATSGWRDAYDLVSQDGKPRMIVSRMSPGGSAKHILVVLPLSEANGRVDCLLIGAFYEGDFRYGEQIEGLLTQELEV